MKFRPIGDLVAVIPELETTDTWLMDHQRRSNNAEVISVGERVIHVRPGDRVYFNRFAGVELKIQGKVILLIHENEIFADEVRRPFSLGKSES